MFGICGNYIVFLWQLRPKNTIMEDNYGIYKYTGPVMLVGDHNQFEFVEGSLVKAEVNINIATIRSFYHQFKEDYEEIPPVYVAAKYLEPVKPATIHFDSKDNNQHDIFWYRKEIERICNEQHLELEIRNTLIGIDIEVRKRTSPNQYLQMAFDENKEASEDNIEVFKRVYEKLVKRIARKNEAEKLFDGNNHEVGGNHYKMAIEPWDFIYANHIPFDESCIIKYACRHKQKNGAEDIKKIISYAKHILKTQYNEEV